MLGLSTDVVLFFLATVITALVGGLGPALLAAVASGLLLNFFLTPPLYTFTISERENVITLVAMVLVAVLVALVVDRAARRAQQAAQARAEAALLASFSRTVLTRSDPLPRLLDKIREAFGLTTVAILQRQDGRWIVSACAGPADCTRPEQADVDVAVDPDTHLVGHGRALAAADRRLLDAVAGQALLALRNQQFAAEAAEAPPPRRRHRAAQRAAVGGRPRPAHPARRRSRLRPGACATRICGCPTPTAASWPPRSRSPPTGSPAWSTTCSTPPGSPPAPSPRSSNRSATTRSHSSPCAGSTAPTASTSTSTSDLPEVLADPGLLERVIANLVDNALRHGRGSAVTVRGSAHANRVELRIVDAGPGVPRGQSDRLFAPFQRLGDRQPGGLGLGLSVARGFTEAMGGTLTADDTPGGGLTIAVSLPSASRPAPAVPPLDPAELAP